MPPLTRRRTGETIRKLGLALACGWFAGCATRGPNHVYVTTASSGAIHDLGATPASIRDAFQSEEKALGLAYDFNTDHLFIRIAPAQVIRVIERPSGKTLREMPLPPGLHTDDAADLAVRSKNRHLFAIDQGGRSVTELTLFGQPVRQIKLAGLQSPATGLAYDQRGDRLLVLSADGNQARIGWVGADGHVTYYVTLAAVVRPVSLGYDSEAQRFHVPLADGRTLGEFDALGNLVSSQTVADNESITAVDAGPRSFVRVF